MNIFDLLKKAISIGASDIHITVGTQPVARCKGRFIKLNEDIITPTDAESIVREIAGDKNFSRVQQNGEADFSASLETGERFRVNAYKQKSNYALAIRTITSEIPTIEKLGLPSVISTFANKHKGLVLVTGPTGSGKSTTIASIIDMINSTREAHIITLEDPIEYVHNHNKSIVNQREIGSDSNSFASALRAALRQDPDVILIGEMRDPETIAIALTAAETGHLVFSTLHTVGSAKTIDRIVDVFHPEQQQQIKTQLSMVCEGIISQQLIPSRDGNGRVAAVEVMVANTAIRNLIREGKTHQIANFIQTGAKLGMQSMDQQLIELYRQGKISKDSVLSRCADYEYTSKMIGGSC